MTVTVYACVLASLGMHSFPTFIQLFKSNKMTPLKLDSEMVEMSNIRNIYGLYGIYVYIRFTRRVYT